MPGGWVPGGWSQCSAGWQAAGRRAPVQGRAVRCKRVSLVPAQRGPARQRTCQRAEAGGVDDLGVAQQRQLRRQRALAARRRLALAARGAACAGAGARAGELLALATMHTALQTTSLAPVSATRNTSAPPTSALHRLPPPVPLTRHQVADVEHAGGVVVAGGQHQVGVHGVAVHRLDLQKSDAGRRASVQQRVSGGAAQQAKVCSRGGAQQGAPGMRHGPFPTDALQPTLPFFLCSCRQATGVGRRGSRKCTRPKLSPATMVEAAEGAGRQGTL